MTRDPLVSTHVIAATPKPQQVCWLSMHQDYSSEPVYKELTPPVRTRDGEQWYGERVVDKCLKFGHWGMIEHPQITVNCCYYPHDVIVQARTHRVSVSFDCQSFRYTGEHLLKVNSLDDLERVFYFRPVGEYTDRKGHKYEYSEYQRQLDMSDAFVLVKRYQEKLKSGFSEEHARQLLPYSYRQHFVVSFNARSLMHFLDLRSKKDAQLEIQWLADDLFRVFKEWMPQVAEFYESNRLHKARLSP